VENSKWIVVIIAITIFILTTYHLPLTTFYLPLTTLFADPLYFDLEIADLYITSQGNIHNIHVLIHDLSTNFVDISYLELTILHNSFLLYSDHPNIPFINNIAHFTRQVNFLPNSNNHIEATIIYPQNVNNSNTYKSIYFWLGIKPIIINEIHFQPRQPEPEWIEFYNATDQPYTLTNAFIQTLSGRRAYFSATISPKNYLIITQNITALTEVHAVIDQGMLTQPTTWAQLPNNGSTITLYLTEYEYIDVVQYNASSANMGKSLERVNPIDYDNPVWRFSTAQIGSTPLAKNSHTPPDVEACIDTVSIHKADGVLEHSLTIINTGLSGSVSANLQLLYKSEYQQDYATLHESTITIQDTLHTVIHTDIPIETGYHYYTYTVLFDEGEDHFHRAFLETNPPVVINEIMANPFTNEPKWLELIKTRDTMPEAGIKITVNNYSSVNIPYFESEFAILTMSASDVTFIREQYLIPEEIPIYRGLQSLNIAGAELTLSDHDDNLYERFSYTAAFSPIRGTSAERISPLLAPAPQNWTASLETSTPAKTNSVYMLVIPTSTTLSIQNKTFSPYRNEHCLITQNATELTTRTDLKIFDLKGREIANLADKTVVSGMYTFIWDGKDSHRHNVLPGAYIVLITIDNMAGKQIFTDKRVVYVGK